MNIIGNKINLEFGKETIYLDADFLIRDNDKVGIVGVNGAGKTTLFRVLLGELELDSGEINMGKAILGHLPQEIVIEDENQTVYEYLKQGRPLEKIEKELSQIYETMQDKSEIEQRAMIKRAGELTELQEYYDVYNAEDILFDLIEKMQIDLDLLEQPMHTLSGGQKSKMAFCRVLYSKSQILLLDEPTNHLDATTKDFVTGYLKNYKGTVLIISHDGDFLDKVINRVLLINKVTHKITIYEGNYTAFQAKYKEEQKNRNLIIDKQEKEIEKLEAFVKRAKEASRTNRKLKQMGSSRAKMLEKKKSELLEREKTYKKIKLHFAPRREGARIPLEVRGLTFGYEKGKKLYKDLNFTIKAGERFLVVGENGIGKSTLLKLLMGYLQPESGKIRFSESIDIAYYAQELEQLDNTKTVLENVGDDNYTEWQLRSVLSNFLFFGDDVYKKLEVLSPGEKARVALCKVLLQKANLLILDEPTNHLDMETQAIIGENFNLFEGTMIVVSHNPAFVEQIGVTRMLVLPFGRCIDYSKEVLEYFYDINTPEDEKE